MRSISPGASSLPGVSLSRLAATGSARGYRAGAVLPAISSACDQLCRRWREARPSRGCARVSPVVAKFGRRCSLERWPLSPVSGSPAAIGSRASDASGGGRPRLTRNQEGTRPARPGYHWCRPNSDAEGMPRLDLRQSALSPASGGSARSRRESDVSAFDRVSSRPLSRSTAASGRRQAGTASSSRCLRGGSRRPDTPRVP